MAEEKEKAKGRKEVAPRVGAAMRYFEAPRVTFMRMGRPVLVVNGAYGSVDIRRGSLEFMRGETEIGEAKLRAERLCLAVHSNVLTAEGKVTIRERGVTLEADRIMATPALTNMRTEGRVRLRSENRQVAEDLLKFHKE